MGIFQGLSVGSSRDIEGAVNNIQHALESQGSGPYSLAELSNGSDDYHWICEWARCIQPPMLRITTWHSGVLLMFLACECGRREGQEGELWPVLQGRFNDNARNELFQNGQPTAFFKEIIHEACERLHLRNVFTNDGVQRWYDSVYLQFGFTRSSIQTKLAEWLAGQEPSQSIRALLHNDALKSCSFEQLWNALRDYRGDALTEAQIRHDLQQSPWVLPDWVDEIVTCAHDRVGELGTTLDDPERTRATPLCVESHRITWNPPEEPRVQCRLASLNSPEYVSSRYELMQGEDVLAVYYRQADGGYQRDDDTPVLLRCGQPAIELILRDADGKVVATQWLDIWDRSNVVNVFSDRGKRCEGLGTGQAHIVQVAADCVIDPKPNEWRTIGDRNWAFIPAGQQLRVLDRRGNIVWTPESAPKPSAPWADRCNIALKKKARQVGWNDNVSFVIEDVQDGVEIEYVRLDGEACDFDPKKRLVGPIAVTPEHAVCGWRFRIGLRRGQERKHIERQPPVPILGVAIRNGQEWQPFAQDKNRPINELRCASLRVFAPECNESRPTLFAGNVLLHSTHKCGKAARLPDQERLSTSSLRNYRDVGLGAPIILRSGVFHSQVLCSLGSGIDFGSLTGMASNPAEGRYRLTLTHPIKPQLRHSIVLWWICGSEPPKLRQYAADAVHVSDEGRIWSIPWPEETQPIAIVGAIAYEGFRLGFAWHGRWQHLLDPAESQQTQGFSEWAERQAALHRWFRLPLLRTDQQTGHPIAQEFCDKYPLEVLSAWLFNRGLADGLRFDTGPAAKKVDQITLRHLLAGWCPEVGHIRRMERLGLADMVKEVFPVMPILGGRILRQACCTPESRTQAIREALMPLRDIAEAPDSAAGRKLEAQEQKLLEDAAKAMRRHTHATCNGYFLKDEVAKEALMMLDNQEHVIPQDVAIASECPQFSEYLSLRMQREVCRRAIESGPTAKTWLPLEHCPLPDASNSLPVAAG